MRLFDTHAHVTDTRFDNDRENMLQLAFSEGLEYILCPSVDRQSAVAGRELASKYENIYVAVGVHPHEAKDATEEDFEAFTQWAEEDKVVAIGEIGLDYYYDFSDRVSQMRVFKRQIDIARQVNLPIIIHDRDAHGDMMDTLKEYGKGVRGVMHCYSGSYEMAMEAIKLDYYISFAGPVAFPNATKLKEVAQKIPLERILVETDSPYLTPPPFRGRRNYPGYVRYVAEEIARLRGMDADEFAEIALENGKRCFSIQ